MSSTTVTVRVDTALKRRLDKLARSTARSSSFLAAQAIEEYLDVNEWQIAGIKKALASVDRGDVIPHEDVKRWVESWGTAQELPRPRPRMK